MASTYTAGLRLELPTTGELSGTWGTRANEGITALLEQAVSGRASVTMTDADYTLTALNGAADEARNAVIRVTGTLSTARNVVCPTVAKNYIFENATTGGFAVTLTTVAGTGVAVPNGSAYSLRCDGVNVVVSFNVPASLLSGSIPIAQGGTGAATAAAARTALGSGAVGDSVFIAATASVARVAISAAASGVNADITRLSSLITPVIATDAVTKAYADALAFAAGAVTSVSGTAPVVSSGGAAPAISMPAATGSVAGHLTAANWTTFNGKQDALVSATNIKTVNSTTLLGSGNLVTGDVTLGGSQTLTNKTLTSPVINTPTGNIVTSVNGDTGAVTVDGGGPAWSAF